MEIYFHSWKDFCWQFNHAGRMSLRCQSQRITLTTIHTMKTIKDTENKTANIHEAPTGLWYITDNALDYLCESGACWKSERSAIKAARESGYWTHRVNRDGRIVKL